MTTWRESRRIQRAELPVPNHLQLLDADADACDAAIAEVRSEGVRLIDAAKTEFNAAVTHLSDDVKAVKAVMIGLLVSIAAAAVLLAANLAFR